ncbi:Cysteine-rich receptor-like protein kinase 6 [Bienertia sinuspersici]
MAKYTFLASLFIMITLHSNLYPGEATTLTITNNCNYKIWPSLIDPTNSTTSYGFSLENGESKLINLPPIQQGRITGRTHCSTDTKTGNFSCQSGDCGSGKINCEGKSSNFPVTLVEFTLGNSLNQDYYDVSVVDGYNLPVAMAPRGSSGGRCAATGCVFNLTASCPNELRVVDKNQSVIGCRNPCDAFKTPESCCSSPDDCKRGSFLLGTLIFKKSCPRAYSYALDDDTSTFTCPSSGMSYAVTFCPSPPLSSLISQPLQSAQLSGSPSPSPSPLSFLVPPSRQTNFTGSTTTSESKRKRTFLLVGLATSAAITVMLFYGVWICVRKKRAIKTSNSEVLEIKKAALDSLQFDLHTIKTATGNFAPENKLGEGGFGEVYKGILENGQEIAVKRLSSNSRQGNAEFKTEVALVAKLRHKNLVKLLGFCVSSDEKILVYEFLPKSSLDRFLMDQTRQSSLDWQTRFKIIIGIARGLLYLHEDSPLKVIHRDLKSSNILLDDDMNPKIADFGLAKLFGVDQTQGNTRRIVGTYGYMAPEYAITGHYSAKSDVYSFGVIVLEMVSGQMNRFFGPCYLEEALLHRAWRLWNDGKSFELVDTTLNNYFSREEIIKCIHIGLLCIQEDAVLRPRMTSIVADLNGQASNLPMPKPPNFFGTTNNNEDNEIQHNRVGVYTGTRTITELYPRD